MLNGQKDVELNQKRLINSGSSPLNRARFDLLKRFFEVLTKLQHYQLWVKCANLPKRHLTVRDEIQVMFKKKNGKHCTFCSQVTS